jgi:hypothetical protein
MPHESNPKYINLTDLASICAQETELFFQHRTNDTRYCFELFRRAVCENDQSAWEVIYNQYQSLVTGWVMQHKGFKTSGEEAQYFVTGAFGKISSILTAEKFGKFSDLQSLLYYLKMCVHSTITDYNRMSDRADLYVSFEELQIEVKGNNPATEEEVVDRIDNQSFWDWINEKLNDEKERLVIEGVFVLALKPRELCDHYAGKFSDVEEVYRIKQNVLARLRRDAEFRKLLGEND